jgi:ABC-type Zn uptake system ZnuABC Zn-binding protein ZnuA
MRSLKVVLPLLALLLVVFQLAVPRPSPAEAQTNRPNVVATFSILGDLVANVGGDQINLVTLVGPNGDVHTFEPNPADSVTLRNAALIVENGVHLETWLDDLYSASGSRAARVAVTEGYPLLAVDEAEEDQAEAAEVDEHGHAHGEFDPHIWQDPAAAMHMVGVIRDALMLTDPANSAVYQANAERYLDELRALDTWASEEIQRVPAANRKLVTTHESFNYFAARYGFTVVGTALPLSTEAADPSVGEMTDLVEKIKATGVPTIFAENATNPRLMQQISQAANVRVALLFEMLGDANSEGSTYLKLIRHNVSTIANGLAP